MRNLLLNEKNELRNRYLHIGGFPGEADIVNKKVDIDAEKVDIQNQKQDIDAEKSDIDIGKTKGFTVKTVNYIQKMFDAFGTDHIFGRSDIVRLLGLRDSSASSLLAKLLKVGIIETVSGYGKGKYKFPGV